MIPELPRRLRESAVLTAPVAVIEMSRHLFGIPHLSPPVLTTWQWLAACLTTLVVFKSGFPLLAKGWFSYANRRLNMFSLIAPGILITYSYSLLALAAPGIFPASFRIHGSVPVYFEAAAMITTLVLMGQFLEARAERHTGDALDSLAALIPDQACVVQDGRETWKPLSELKRDDYIRLRPGDRVPADGVVVSGEAAVDESMLTGEPLPAAKSENDEVTGGTLVHDGTLLIRVVKAGDDTVLAHIVRMVRQAQDSKAPIQRLADRVTGKLVPLVLLTAAVTVLIWWIWGPPPSLWYGMLHGITVLMITCPCALGLATPVSITAGMGRGALSGILIKDAAHLEKLAGTDIIVLDKTGTLTTGKPVLRAVLAKDTDGENEVLQLAASVEHYSQHPAASAILSAARERGLDSLSVDQFESVSGKGVKGRVDGRTIHVGQKNWLNQLGINDVAALLPLADQHEREGCTTVWLARDGTIEGLLVLADQLKPHIKETVAGLKQRGLELALLTGDAENSARFMARAAGIEHVYARVLPDGKADTIAALSSSGKTTVMVGDGINDAPALATADVGIAIGAGTDTARASGHIILTSDDLTGLTKAIDLSRAVMRNIKQNLIFAFAYNVIMIPVAAGALYPSTRIILTPMLASLAMSASCITVITNALRLRRLKLAGE